jgi:hypothetical protein
MNPHNQLRARLLTIASRAAQGAAYENWSDSFARKEVAEVWASEGPITVSDLREMSAAELDALGFSLWDENGPRLIPLWAWGAIKDGEPLVSISGNTKPKGDECDLDVRGGCTAWGFSPA